MTDKFRENRFDGVDDVEDRPLIAQFCGNCPETVVSRVRETRVRGFQQCVHTSAEVVRVIIVTDLYQLTAAHAGSASEFYGLLYHLRTPAGVCVCSVEDIAPGGGRSEIPGTFIAVDTNIKTACGVSF